MPQNEETQVCIIGAGAAGGIIAYELAQRGIEVVILESGPRHDFSKRFAYAQRFLRGENPWRSPIPEMDAHTTSGDAGYPLDWQRARGVGGSTLHWEGYTPRFHANDFRLRTLYGVGRDWPISYDDLEPYYTKAETALGVAGAANDPWASPRSSPFPLPAFDHSYSDQFFEKACKSLGITFSKQPQARNSVKYRGRSQCVACGTCYVCPTGAKAGTELTHIPQAEATGKARVITDATVLKIESGGNKVEAVTWTGRDHVERTLHAEIFVIAAGGVETPRLLLLSRSTGFPNGLANSSGLVGRGFMSHPMVEIVGRTKQNMFPHRVGFSSAMSRQFAVEGDRGKRGAFTLEFLNTAGSRPDFLAMMSGKTGKELRQYVEREFGHTLGMRIYCEQLPDEANAVILSDSAKDHLGRPAPHISYSIGPYERASAAEGKEIARKILKGAGASDIHETWLGAAAHQIGTVRMGRDPKTSVVNENLRTHDLENLYLVGSGCFPSATCNHPTLTISALAIRAAEHIAMQTAALR
jgi:glucose dehydrogenase